MRMWISKSHLVLLRIIPCSINGCYDCNKDTLHNDNDKFSCGCVYMIKLQASCLLSLTEICILCLYNGRYFSSAVHIAVTLKLAYYAQLTRVI